MITSLTPGTEYLFVVTALIEEVPESRGFSTPPQEITISEVTHTSFVVTWELLPSATRYGIKIYGEDRTTELYSDAKIATKSAYISNLSPGTVYYVGIKSANRQQGLGPLSRLVGVRTNGPVNTDSERYWPSIVYSAPSTTTSTAATTTTATPLTVCQQRYQSVVQFNRGSAVQRPLPNCDSDGNFVATVCPNGPSFCYCVVPETGVKRPGTEFGSSVNGRRIPLQCNRYGTFASQPSEISVSGIESTRATVEWSAANGAFGYIIIVSAVGQTDKIYHVISGTNVRVTDLEPGKRYTVKVIAVDSNGIASQSVSINFMTTIVDKPEKLKITYSRMNKIMATWRIEDSATSYNVDLLDSAGQVVNSMQEIEQNNVEFTNLVNLEVYTIRVRSVSRHFDDGGTERVYVSPSVEVSSLVLCSLPPIDVIFVFDISNRLTNNELTIVKNLFSDVLIALPPVNLAAPSGTRVAAVKYLPWVQNIFSFSRFNTTGNAVGAMKYSKWYGGNPNTNYMLDFVYTRYFASTARPGYSKRPSATSVVIVFSGGKQIQ
uniref:Fibronectin n=1 Tax=Ciona savignyi TaxID=51511 RepID=H2Z974_CIOSA